MTNNLFALAIQKNELEDFFLGLNEYFVLDREYGEHWPYGSFEKYMLPYSKFYGEEIFQKDFWKVIESLLNSAKDSNLVLDAIVNYLTIFYYNNETIIKQSRVANTPFTIINLFKEKMADRRNSLVNDKRSVGVDWNTSENKGLGLWGGIIYNLNIIKDRVGLDFIPDTVQ